MRAARLLPLVIALLAASPLHAQTARAARGVFVDLRLGPDWNDAADEDARIPGVSPSIGLAVGVDGRRSGVEVSVRVPQWHRQDEEPWRYTWGGATQGFQQQGHEYETVFGSRQRTIEVMALWRFGVRLASRATLRGLAGGGYVVRPSIETTVTREVLPSGARPIVDTSTHSTSRNYKAASAQAEIEWRVASHLSIDPRVSVTMLPSWLDDSGFAARPFSARPEVAARWTF
jgi:hypothetical protein